MHSHILIYLAHFYSEAGDFGEAQAALAKARSCTALERYPVFGFEAELVAADLLLKQGERPGGEAALHRALALGARCGYYGGLFWLPRLLERLCAEALERGIEVDYVRALIARRDLKRPSPEAVDWPCPLRVFTLGGFALERDGVPIRFAGKVPKKPLELLKALVALGGPEVAAHTLRGALWPDAPTQAADNALGITLKRLRTLLGDERAVTQQGGKLRLDPHRCWVDAWALQTLLARAKALPRARAALPELAALAARIGDLHRGAFLADDPELPWAAPLRERLRARVTALLLSVGRGLEQAGRTQAAIGFYTQALEQDPLAEEVYRRLMLCHARLGARAEAMAVYRRCRDLLSIVLGIQPATATDQVFRALQAPAARASGQAVVTPEALRLPAPPRPAPAPTRFPPAAGPRRGSPSVPDR